MYLFVGGSRDGERSNVERETVAVPVMNGERVFGDVPDSALFQYEHYRSFRIRGEQCEFVVYALEELSPDEIFRKLLANYRPLSE